MSNAGRMSATRRKRLMEQLALRDIVRVGEIAEALQVSEITIRRDLDELAESGLVERFHGGARLIAQQRLVAAPVADASEVSRQAEKEVVADRAADYVRRGETVLLSGGTTTLAVFRRLVRRDVHIITNNAMVLAEMADDSVADLFVLGGEYNQRTRALNGDLTNLTLNQIHANVCILGTNAINQLVGLTSSIYAAAAINKLMASQSAGNVIVVADSSKVGQTSNFVSLPLNQIRVLITDTGAEPTELAAYRAAGVEVVVCDAPLRKSADPHR